MHRLLGRQFRRAPLNVRTKQKASQREASSIACLKMCYFFFAFIFDVSVFIFEVSVILIIVSGAGVTGAVVVVSGATVVLLSLVVELLPLLLQAAKAPAIIAIAKNFFICRIFENC